MRPLKVAKPKPLTTRKREFLNYLITSFDSEVFKGKDRVVRVMIPVGVTAIPDQAFLNCKNLKGVTIDATAMTSIGYQAFKGCYNMESFVIPNTVTTLGNGVFSGCSALEEVTIGDGVTTLPGVAISGTSYSYGNGEYFDSGSGNLGGNVGLGFFYSCTSLKTINWGAGLKTIGRIAFLNCSALETLEIPDTVTEIGDHAFCGCAGLVTVKTGAKVTKIGRGAFCALPNLTGVSFGPVLTDIGKEAFRNCVNLQNFTLPASIQNLRYACFAGCSKALTAVTIPTNEDELTTELEQAVFSGCTKLEEVTLGDTVKSIPGVAISRTSYSYGNGEYFDSGSGNLGGNVGLGFFYSCTSLKTINWGAGLETIGNIAFLGCTALETVTLPANVSAIGKHAFYGCSALRTIEVNGKVKSIGRRAFANCANLRYVDFQGPSMAFDAGEEIFAFDKAAVIAYAAEGSTGWTGVADVSGLPASGTWRGARIMYGPADKELGNPYDFYPYVPTAKVRSRDYDWPSPLMLTKTRYLHGSTIPETVAEFKQGETIYLTYAFDEYWRGNMFENLTNTFALSGAKTAQEDIVRKVTSRDYPYCWGTNVTLNILNDLEPGDYTLTMNLNAGRNLAETDYENNTTSLTFKVVGRASYTVKFNAHGGTPDPTDRNRYEDTEVGELPSVTREGYEFNGWYTAEKDGNKVDKYTKVTADVTYHAQWTKLPNIIFWKPTDMTWTETMFVAAKSNASSGKTTFAEGDPVYFYYACYEQDGQSVSAFVNRFKVVGDNGYEKDLKQDVYGINSGRCAGVYGQTITGLQNLKPGAYTLTCTLNADNDVAEFDTSDNVQTISFTVVAAGTPIEEDDSGDSGSSGESGSSDEAGSSGSSGESGLPTPPEIVTELTGTVPEGGATYTGYAYGEGGQVIGTFTLVVGKQKGGTCTLKLTRIDLLTGQKVTEKAALDAATGQADGALTGLKVGADGVLGTIASVGKLEGGLDVVKAKNSDGLTVLGKFDARGCTLAFSSTPVSGAGAAFAYGNFGFAVTFGKKGKAKIAGVLPDGAKVSLTSQLIVGKDACCLPVMYAKKNKGSFGFLLWFDPQKMTVTALTGMTPLVSSGKTPYEATVKCLGVGALGGNLDAGAVFNAQFDVLPQSFKEVMIATTKALGLSILPNGLPVDGRAANWILPKAGKVAQTKDKMDLDVSKFTAKGETTPNPAALKLSYTAKKGTFKGSFSLYQDVNGKPKKVSAAVNGIVVNGVGYGSAVIKRVGSVPVTVGK